jgi:hypothetical protein
VVITPKGAGVSYVESMDFRHASTIPLCNWVFKNFHGGWEIQRAFKQAITWEIMTLPPNVMIFFKDFFHMRACYQPLP